MKIAKMQTTTIVVRFGAKECIGPTLKEDAANVQIITRSAGVVQTTMMTQPIPAKTQQILAIRTQINQIMAKITLNLAKLFLKVHAQPNHVKDISSILQLIHVKSAVLLLFHSVPCANITISALRIFALCVLTI